MFKDVSEAFNHYRTMTIEAIEARAKEINSIIDTNADADIDQFNIELEGLKEAKQNIVEARSTIPTNLKPVKDNTMTNENINVVSTPEYRSAFYKTLLKRTLTDTEKAAWDQAHNEFRSNEYNTVSNAAAVIPTATLNEVISKARTIGGFLPRARMFNMPSKVAIPVGTPLGNASWNTEGAAVETEKASVVKVDFANNEIIRVLALSASTDKMSIDAFESYLVEELTTSVMGCLAHGAINGDNSTYPVKGIDAGITWVTTPGATQNAVEFSGDSSELTYKDLIAGVSLLKRGYANGAVFVMNNKTLWNHVYGLVDGNNRPMFLQDLQKDDIGRLMGYEVIVDDNMADDTIIFGNPRYYGVNIVNGIAIESSREAAFTSGQVLYRAMAIADEKPIVSEAFVKISKPVVAENGD